MRKSIAVTAALALILVVAPTPSAEAGVINSVTASGQIRLWDHWECTPDNPDPPNHCFEDGEFHERQPAELFAPASPACAPALCPSPSTYDWVFDMDGSTADTPACVASTGSSPTYDVAGVSAGGECLIDAVGRMTFGVTGGGPWCGTSGGNLVQNRPARVQVGSEVWEFVFSFPILMQHTGTTATWLLRDADTLAVNGVAEMTLLEPHGSCGLAPPDFEPATGFDVTFTFTWTDAAGLTV